MSANPKIDTNAIMDEIRANTAKLEGCAKPHDFSIDATPNKPLFKKWQCSKCGGKTDAINRIWYQRGLQDAKNIENQIVVERRIIDSEWKMKAGDPNDHQAGGSCT